MIDLEKIRDIAVPTASRILLIVLDGLGGLPHQKTGKTELESAKTVNLDQLAKEGICGMVDPVGPGITPGSAPGHLALFGYDPVAFTVGRGVLEALGIDLELKEGDVAARGNFCTVDGNGIITDRRAGRITTDQCAKLCQMLDGITIEKVKISTVPVREHRFVAVFHGDRFSSALGDSDPQQVGVSPKAVASLASGASKSVRIVNKFISKAQETLSSQEPANMILLRGFSNYPEFPRMHEVFGLKPAAIASYPMYRGLAKLVGMDTLPAGQTMEDGFFTLVEHYKSYDFFFVHIKATDSAGEDGDFARKVKVIEEFDRTLPRFLSLKPEVVIVTADHSTPAVLKGHSWHPVPFLLHSRWCRPDGVVEFSERACIGGALGRFEAKHIMPLALANALKLKKYGA